MPGFGDGPFGNVPFGHFPWSKTVLYDYVPELHRVQDAETGYTLRKWADAQRPSYDGLLNRIFLFDTLRDPRYVRTQYSEVYPIVLGTEVLGKPKIEQRGIDGRINSFREFVAESVRFTEDDTGKVIALTRSSVAANNREYQVARVIDPTSAVFDPLPSADAGSGRWELRKATTRKEGVVTLQVRDGDASLFAPGYILNDGFGDYTILARRLFERTDDLKHLTVREGADGSIDNTGRFVSPTLGVLPSDQWKYLFIDGVDPEAPKRVIDYVTPGVGGTTVELRGTTLAENAGPLTWALLPFPEIDIAASSTPKGTVEQEGGDLTFTNPNLFSAPSMRLTSLDVGKFLTTCGSVTDPLDNNRIGLKIATVASPTSGTFDQTFGDGAVAVATESGLTWEVRSSTERLVSRLADPDDSGSAVDTESFVVTVRASSLITAFTKDFGIETDEQETERRQRNWVRHLTQWTDKKGTQRAYNSLSRVSGVETTFTPLFAVDQANAASVDSFTLAFPDWENPRTGSDGSLLFIDGDVHFVALSATFAAGDEGHYLQIEDSTSGNSQVFEIQERISADTVKLHSLTFGTVPDASNGALTWTVVSYYTDVAPARVLADDVNVDLVSEIVSVAISAGPGSGLNDGDTFELDDGNSSETYEFDDDASVGGGNIAVTFTGGMTAAQVATAIVDTINAETALEILAFNNSGRTTVSLAHTGGLGGEITANGTGVITPDEPLPFFYPDYLCGADHFTTATPVYVIAATQLSLFFYAIDVIGTAEFNDAPEVVSAIGNWFVKDSLGTEFFLESVPVANGTDGVSGRPMYRFNVAATAAPVVSAVTASTLDYRCELVLDCGYCATHKIEVTIEPDAELLTEGTVALEDAISRAVARLKQAKPAHVEFVVSEVEVEEPGPGFAYMFGGRPYTGGQPASVGFQIERWDYSADTSSVLEATMDRSRYYARPLGNFECAIIVGGYHWDVDFNEDGQAVEKFDYATEVSVVSSNLASIPEFDQFNSAASASNETVGIYLFHLDDGASEPAFLNKYTFASDTWEVGASLTDETDYDYAGAMGNTTEAYLMGEDNLREYSYAEEVLTTVASYLAYLISYEQSASTAEYGVYWSGTNNTIHDWLGIYVFSDQVTQSAAVSLSRSTAGIATVRKYVGMTGNGEVASICGGDCLDSVGTGFGPTSDIYVDTVSYYDYATQTSADVGSLIAANNSGSAMATRPGGLLPAAFATPTPAEEGMSPIQTRGGLTFSSVGTIDLKIPSLVMSAGLSGGARADVFMLATMSISVPGGDLASNYGYTLPAGWTLVRQENSGRRAVAVFYRFSDGAEPNAYTITNTFPSGCNGSCMVTLYTNVDPVSPIVGHAFATTTGTAIDAPSVTIEAAYGRMIVVVGADSTLNVTEPTTMIPRNKGGSFALAHRYGQADEIIPEAGASGVRNWTWTDSVAAHALSVSIRRAV